MNAPRDKSYDESLTTALTDPDEAAAYLDAVMELEDPGRAGSGVACGRRCTWHSRGSPPR